MSINNKKVWLTGLALSLLTLQISTLSQVAQASELDLALGKETAAAEIYLDTRMLNGSSGKLSFGGLYNESDDLLGFVGIGSNGTIGYDSPYELGVGARAYYVSVDQPDVSVGAVALGISGKVKYTVGNLPLALAGDFHYAPKITTFSDGDELVDSRVRIEGQISNNSAAFIGYRRIKLNLKDYPNHKLDDHIQMGIRFKF